jgi:hypothetical protein
MSLRNGGVHGHAVDNDSSRWRDRQKASGGKSIAA